VAEVKAEALVAANERTRGERATAAGPRGSRLEPEPVTLKQGREKLNARTHDCLRAIHDSPPNGSALSCERR
jgi:hypothetical protein